MRKKPHPVDGVAAHKLGARGTRFKLYEMARELRIARATALMAVNAYTLIRCMTLVEEFARGASPLVVGFLILVPLAGLATAFLMLGEKERDWLEPTSMSMVGLIIAVWMWAILSR